MKTENKMRKDLIFVFALTLGAFLILKLKQEREQVLTPIKIKEEPKAVSIN